MDETKRKIIERIAQIRAAGKPISTGPAALILAVFEQALQDSREDLRRRARAAITPGSWEELEKVLGKECVARITNKEK